MPTRLTFRTAKGRSITGRVYMACGDTFAVIGPGGLRFIVGRDQVTGYTF